MSARRSNAVQVIRSGPFACLDGTLYHRARPGPRARADRHAQDSCMIRIVATLLASAALAALPLQARAELDVARLKGAIERSVESDYAKLEALYQDIHAHPELAFQEVKTAAKLAAEMRSLGFEV